MPQALGREQHASLGMPQARLHDGGFHVVNGALQLKRTRFASRPMPIRQCLWARWQAEVFPFTIEEHCATRFEVKCQRRGRHVGANSRLPMDARAAAS